MGSAEVTPPPHSDFVRAYYLTSPEYGASSIGLRRLKVARFSDVNDPFELLALNFRERAVRRVARSFKSANNTHTGLLCFSANWTNPVLWSHYAAKHQGICLGFDLRRSGVQLVLYEDERLLVELSKEDGNPLAIGAKLREVLLRTKSHHWAYEEELRIFVPLSKAVREGRLYFSPFGDDIRLVEVILGPQCSLSLAAVRRLTRATNPEAIAYRARLAFKFFNVVPDERSVPKAA